MKGGTGSVLPFVVLLVGAGAFGVQVFNVADAFSDEIELSVEDLSRVAETHGEEKRILYDNMKNSIKFSVHQETHELAQNRGGVRWTSEALDLEDTVALVSHMRARAYFDENYGDMEELSTRCDFEMDDYEFTYPLAETLFESRTEHVAGVFDVTDVSEDIRCSFRSTREDGGTEQVVSADSQSLITSYNTTYNRYFSATSLSAELLQGIRDEWNTMDTEFETTEVNCGGGFAGTEGMVDELENEAENELVDSVDAELASFPNEGFAIQTDLRDFGFSTDVDTSTGECGSYEEISCDIVVDESSTDSSCDAGDIGSIDPDDEIAAVCPGEERTIDGELQCVEDNTETEYEKTVTLNLDDFAELYVSFTDGDYRVPTEDGWERIEFEVENYLHDFGGLDLDFEATEVENFGTVYEDAILEGVLPEDSDPIEYAQTRPIYQDQDIFQQIVYEDYEQLEEELYEIQLGEFRDFYEQLEEELYEIQLGEFRDFGAGTVHFYAETGSLRNKLLFNPESDQAEECAGSTPLTPIEEIGVDADPCSYSIRVSDDEYMGVCTYEEGSDTATVTFSEEATNLAAACHGVS